MKPSKTIDCSHLRGAATPKPVRERRGRLMDALRDIQPSDFTGGEWQGILFRVASLASRHGSGHIPGDTCAGKAP